MKFIHTADLHIDSKIGYLPSSLSFIRREEILHSFERLCEYAKANSVKAIIIAGDLFDSKKITKKAIDRVRNAISLCDTVDFLYLKGNHDENSNEQAVFELFPSNFKHFEQEFSSFRYDNVVVSGLMPDCNSVLQYDKCVLNSGDYNILVMHGEIVNYKGRIKSSAISLPMLKDKNIDYLALGHYHSFNSGVIDLRGHYAYSGCLDGRGFDELGQKGFVLIDSEKEQPYTFIPFSSRQYFESYFSVTNFDSWATTRAEVLQKLKNEIDKNNLVKLVLEGEHSQNFSIDKCELEQRLREFFFYAKIEDNTILRLNQEEYLLDKTVKGEFLRLVWESDLSDEQKKKVISCGLGALKGEDLL